MENYQSVCAARCPHSQSSSLSASGVILLVAILNPHWLATQFHIKRITVRVNYRPELVLQQIVHHRPLIEHIGLNDCDFKSFTWYLVFNPRITKMESKLTPPLSNVIQLFIPNS